MASTDPVLPDSMVERVTAAIRERLDDLGSEGRDQEGTLDGSLWLDGLDAVAADLAHAALAAALEGCEVRIEEGAQLTWADGQVTVEWDGPFEPGRARRIVDARPGLHRTVTAILLRRLVIAAPSEPVPATPEEPQP